MDITGVHIEPTNICTLKCPACARTEFINQWPQHWKNYSLDVDQTMNFLDIDLTNKAIVFCGNYGDPIYHPDFINFVARFKEKKATVTIITNGSYKTKSWWQDLTGVLTEKDTITFSIDGTPENFTKYRINANWPSIQIGIETAASSKVSTVWKYIPFAFNENDIDEVQRFSESLNVDKFFVEPSERFNQIPEEFRPRAESYIDRTSQYTVFNKQKLQKVNPKCKNQQNHFISADGHYSPCCYLADHRFYYKTEFGKNKKEYSIADTTISQLLNQSKVVNFYQNIQTHTECQFTCPG